VYNDRFPDANGCWKFYTQRRRTGRTHDAVERTRPRRDRYEIELPAAASWLVVGSITIISPNGTGTSARVQ